MKLLDLPRGMVLQPLEQATLAQLLAEAFPPSRTPRSHAYRLGVQCALFAGVSGQVMPGMYDAGTTAFDAFHSGADEGRAIWARHLATLAELPTRQVTPANASDLLAAELLNAGEIIAVLLARATPHQLSAARNDLERAGVILKSGTVSRAVERTAVLVQTGFMARATPSFPKE